MLKFKPQDFDRAYCGAWLNGWIYETCLALDIEWQLISYEFMSQLSEFSQYFLTDKTMKINQLPTFWKYFGINNGGQTDKLPGFVMYISHDEILGAFYKALGWDHVKGALPASSLYIEFYRAKQGSREAEARFLQATNDIKVRVFFNDTAGQPGVPVQLYKDSSKQNKIETL